MIKNALGTIKSNIQFLFFLSMIVFVTPTFAYRPVISLGAGGSIPLGVTESQNFPIVDPITDEFFFYSADHQLQGAWLVDGFLGVEWDISRCWKAQLGFDYNEIAPFTAKGSLTQGADISSENFFSYEYKVSSRVLLAEGKLFFTGKRRYYLYLLAGLGVSFNSAYNFNTNVPALLTFTRNFHDHTETAFSYAVGFGFDFLINDCSRIGAAYRFVGLGRARLNGANIDTTPVLGTLSERNIYTNQIFIQFTWLFDDFGYRC